MAPWTIARQAPLSMEFSRQEYWSGKPFLSPGDLPDPGIKPGSPALQADSLQSEPPGKPKKGRGINKCGCILSVSIEASPVPAVFLRFLNKVDTIYK